MKAFCEKQKKNKPNKEEYVPCGIGSATSLWLDGYPNIIMSGAFSVLGVLSLVYGLPDGDYPTA